MSFFWADHEEALRTLIVNNLAIYGFLGLLLIIFIFIMIVLLRKSKVAEQTTSKLNAELAQNLNKLNENYNIIQSISTLYTSIFYINVRDDTFVTISSVYKEVSQQIGDRGKAQDRLNYMCEHMISSDSDIQAIKDFVDLSTLNERLRDKSYISIQYKGAIFGWVEGAMIAADRDYNGNLIHVIWAMRDINYQKHIEFEQRDALKLAVSNAERANRAKTVFLNSMSHDIRTPMNAIIGFTALAYSHMDDKELLQDYLGKINISSNHLLSLINDVLDMSRIESGKVKLEDKVVHLPDVMNDLMTISNSEIEKKHIDFLINYEVINDNVFCDKLRLNQILLNLISNAMKYTKEGGKVALSVFEKTSVRRGYGIFEFHVRDNGIGMNAEFLKHVFEPFEREHTVTENGIQGSGLGLSITKNLVDMMGGTIEVRSEEGVGTEVVISISFKICKQEIPSEEPVLKKIEKKDISGKHILLVEDNALNQEIAVEILKESGFVVDVADDGDVAVEIMRKAPAGKYDLILMDIQMPKMDGYTATREIRTMTNPQVANIPIVAMTANAFDEDKQKSISVGMNAHVAKPINVDQLLETIGSFI